MWYCIVAFGHLWVPGLLDEHGRTPSIDQSITICSICQRLILPTTIDHALPAKIPSRPANPFYLLRRGGIKIGYSPYQSHPVLRKGQ
jgi:hypothetical protein